MAISFVSAATQAHWRLIAKRHHLNVPHEHILGFEPVETQPPNPADPLSTGGIKGKRPSKKDKLHQVTAAITPASKT